MCIRDRDYAIHTDYIRLRLHKNKRVDGANYVKTFHWSQRKELKFGRWSFAANQTGGFWAFYWEMENELLYNDEIPFSPYLQIQYNLETDKRGTIAFRISINQKFDKYFSEIRNCLLYTSRCV